MFYKMLPHLIGFVLICITIGGHKYDIYYSSKRVTMLQSGHFDIRKNNTYDQ